MEISWFEIILVSWIVIFMIWTKMYRYYYTVMDKNDSLIIGIEGKAKPGDGPESTLTYSTTEENPR